MKCLWDFNLQELVSMYSEENQEQKPCIGENIHVYYEELCKTARSRISSVSDSTFSEALPVLFAIDMKCQLVLFYIMYDAKMKVFSDLEIIFHVEKDYREMFREIFDLPVEFPFRHSIFSIQI